MDNSLSYDSDDQPFRPERQAPYLRLHHVDIFVRDQERSLKFYVDQLGFSLVFDHRFEDRSRFIVVAPPDGTGLIALIEPRPESAEFNFIGQGGRTVFVSDDVVGQFRAWGDRGVHFHHPPQKAAWGGMYSSFEDCDGNSFILVGWDDVSREVEARRRAIAQKLELERRAAQELEIAKQVQARLFPQTKPTLASLEYAGICIQAREVGGDYYDFLNLATRRLGLVIGDISGKGMAAALLMANLQGNLRSQCAMALDQPQLFLQLVNRLFYENTNDSVYATLFFAEYDDETRRLRYVNCGHLPAILLRSDRTTELLASTSTVLGLFKHWDCSMEERTLSQGDTLVLYTDGVTEAENDAGVDFGEQRLIQALLRHHELSSERLITSVIDELRRFSPHELQDDITLIVAKCK